MARHARTVRAATLGTPSLTAATEKRRRNQVIHALLFGQPADEEDCSRGRGRESPRREVHIDGVRLDLAPGRLGTPIAATRSRRDRNGPLEASLRQRAPTSVRFLHSQTLEGVAAQMGSARALVFPSICYEGQGLVALEAAAAGLLMVVSNLGAMTGLFALHARELLFPHGDADALDRRLDALEDADLVDAQGAVARRCFEEWYSHQVALERLKQQIYQEVSATSRGHR